MNENVILGDVGEEAPSGPPQKCVAQTESLSLWNTDLFGPTEDEIIWAKAVEGTTTILTQLFQDRWRYVYIFQDSKTEHFFFKSYNGKAGGIVSPEEAWGLVLEGYQLSKDRPMEKYQLVMAKRSELIVARQRRREDMSVECSEPFDSTSTLMLGREFSGNVGRTLLRT